jgi:hypothetical protein
MEVTTGPYTPAASASATRGCGTGMALLVALPERLLLLDSVLLPGVALVG